MMMKRPGTEQSTSGGHKVMNPPSIPSHLSVFGYEENHAGQLIKQKSNQVGFTGVANDRVGPGDYEIINSKNITGKTPTGVIQWKKPKTGGTNVQKENQIPKPVLPGPGQYEVTSTLARAAGKPQSMFSSKV